MAAAHTVEGVHAPGDQEPLQIVRRDSLSLRKGLENLLKLLQSHHLVALMRVELDCQGLHSTDSMWTGAMVSISSCARQRYWPPPARASEPAPLLSQLAILEGTTVITGTALCQKHCITPLTHLHEKQVCASTYELANDPVFGRRGSLRRCEKSAFYLSE